jgi:hypothetical protein
MRGDRIVCTLGVCTDLANELVRRTTANTTVIDLCEDFESCKSYSHTTASVVGLIYMSGPISYLGTDIYFI